MMSDKRYLLFVVFVVIVEQSISIDFNRKGSKNGDDDDDGYQQLSAFNHNRYAPYHSSSNNYRSRSHWPLSFDDRYDTDDWSSYGYGLNNILNNFPGPLPPAAFDSGAYLNNGPNCYSLLDSQYPLFSDICGAVPQARYSLPNSFGHLERWQIAQVLTGIVGPSAPISANPVCMRSLRLLLCPLLFPPCPTRYEPPPVLPCQPFCRVVKNQCAAPSLDLLPCDLLPPTSDLCPINPSPYSSLLSSFAPPLSPNGGQQSPLSSLLAQSALSLAFSPPDSPPSARSSLFSPPPFSSMFSPSPYSSPGVPSPPFASSFPSSSGFPSSPFSSPFPSSAMPPSGSSLSPINPFFNIESYMADSLTPILVDFPPIQYAQGYQQPPRYFPRTRSATEKV